MLKKFFNRLIKNNNLKKDEKILENTRRKKMRDRAKQRENRKKKRQLQALLDVRNMYGQKDLTAYNAVLQMRTNGQAEIRLR